MTTGRINQVAPFWDTHFHVCTPEEVPKRRSHFVISALLHDIFKLFLQKKNWNT